MLRAAHLNSGIVDNDFVETGLDKSPTQMFQLLSGLHE